ncbi:MAG: nucleoside monophosphate kinase [Endomicrobium sp.]|jgi:adenylate kinase|nr:nucleoside monophosphate kinase [Endomicrobium sp.]
MNCILLSPPGAGKGTQAKNIVENFNMLHFSAGDMLRKAKEYDKTIDVILSSGQLVPDDVIVNIINEKLERENVNNGFILDGFPRNITQANRLNFILEKKNIKIDKVFFIDIDFNEAINRITGRRICRCGASYNIVKLPPKENGKCDYCYSDLIQRNDDKEDILIDRFIVYKNQTEPLIDYYKKKNLLVVIDGLENEKKVFMQISSYISCC